MQFIETGLGFKGLDRVLGAMLPLGRSKLGVPAPSLSSLNTLSILAFMNVDCSALDQLHL